MAKTLWIPIILITLLTVNPAVAQDESSDDTNLTIDGTWITESGNLVELTTDGTTVDMYFPEYARYKTATFNGSVLVYVTHYNDPTVEEVYMDVPDSEQPSCRGFVSQGEPRHRFTLTLSDDGMVLSGIKEINVLNAEWDTDENGNTFNHRLTGFTWVYFSDYTWRRANCDFNGYPPLDGNAIEKYTLIEALMDNFDVYAEFGLTDFNPRERIRFVYNQNYLDADTGVFVTTETAAEHPHLEPLDGRVYLDSETGNYMMELYPYSFQSYVSLLSGITMLSYQFQELEDSGGSLTAPTTQIEIDSVNYVWSHRQAMCSHEDELFDHHIDFLSRALQYRALAED